MTLTLLIQSVTSLFPSANYSRDYTVSVDAGGDAVIATWNATVGPQPTVAQLEAALSALQLGQAKAAQIAILQAAYNAAGYANVSYMGSSFPVSQSTMLLLSSTLIQGSTPQGLPSGFQWFDADGTGVSMSYAQLQSLGNAFFGQIYPAFVRLQGLIQAVYAATSIAAVQAIIWD